jgi:hypothetical protein
MMALSVNQIAPHPFWPVNALVGARIEQVITGDWFVTFYLDRVAPVEQQVHALRTIEARYLADKTGSMLLCFVGFDKTPLVYELRFDPTIYHRHEWDQRRQMYQETNLATFLLIDSATGYIKALRHANFPDKLWQICSYTWSKALTIDGYTEKYRQWVEALYKQSPLDLWKIATAAGSFGESYNLEQSKLLLNPINS